MRKSSRFFVSSHGLKYVDDRAELAILFHLLDTTLKSFAERRMAWTGAGKKSRDIVTELLALVQEKNY